MPEMHPSAASAAMPPGSVEAAQRWLGEDVDYALGCECADPSLQIERWRLEASQVPGTD